MKLLYTNERKLNEIKNLNLIIVCLHVFASYAYTPFFTDHTIYFTYAVNILIKIKCKVYFNLFKILV